MAEHLGAMRLAKNIALFGAMGLLLSLVFAGLASLAPSVFGWLTVPFWLLPALIGQGAHDMGALLLFLPSGTLCYGVLSFLGFRWTQRFRR
jgi:hypothetical protein